MRFLPCSLSSFLLDEIPLALTGAASVAAPARPCTATRSTARPASQRNGRRTMRFARCRRLTRRSPALALRSRGTPPLPVVLPRVLLHVAPPLPPKPLTSRDRLRTPRGAVPESRRTGCPATASTRRRTGPSATARVRRRAATKSRRRRRQGPLTSRRRGATRRTRQEEEEDLSSSPHSFALSHRSHLSKSSPFLPHLNSQPTLLPHLQPTHLPRALPPLCRLPLFQVFARPSPSLLPFDHQLQSSLNLP